MSSPCPPCLRVENLSSGLPLAPVPKAHLERGFTLLELIVSFTILVLFVLPILEIIAASRMRAVKYTRERIVRDLAQRKLFDRIYSIELMDQGTFEQEGHPELSWEVLPPTIVSQGEQVLLEYTIRVMTPQALEAADTGASIASGESGGSRGSGGSFEMSAWTFPSKAWIQEQEELQAMGYDTVLFGGALDGGAYPGVYDGF